LLDGRKTFFEGHGFPFFGSKEGAGRRRAGFVPEKAGAARTAAGIRFILVSHCKPPLSAHGKDGDDN